MTLLEGALEPRTDGRQDDSQLIARFYAGDEAAFEVMAGRWRPRFFGFFFKLGFGAEDAEDLAQETLVQLYVTREGTPIDVDRPLEPFAFAVARNLAIRDWRKRRARVITVPLSEAQSLAAAQRSSGALSGDLQECLRRLPEAQQTYFLLCGKHGLGELSHNEIAQVLGKWPAQVTAISQQARDRLRDCMERKGYR